jgi:hypothetical protein
MTASLNERPTMSQSIASARVPSNIDRSSYRPTFPFGYSLLLPPAPPTAPLATITPSELASQIASDLIAIREVGARQDELAAQIRRDRRRAEWARSVEPLYAGVELG